MQVGFQFGFEVKELFFKPEAVLNKLAAAEEKALSKFGAFVRRRARSSIRKRKGVSAAGQPPSSHTAASRTCGRSFSFTISRGIP